MDNFLELFGVSKDEYLFSEEERGLATDALVNAMTTIRENHGTLDVTFGDVFRAGRLDYDGDDVSYPVGGGSLRDEGMATVRAIGFGGERGDHTRWGSKGQTSTQVVVMTTPIQSWSQPPIGQSDHPESPHFRDQAEQLLSKSRMKPSWFQKADLLDGHVREEIHLDYPSRAFASN